VWFVYILRCADNSLYIGETSNLESRLLKHHEGSACAFTTSRRPVVLAYREAHTTHDAALKRERQLKRWTRAKKEALIAGDVARLKDL
jgi:putative endonuclease